MAQMRTQAGLSLLSAHLRAVLDQGARLLNETYVPYPVASGLSAREIAAGTAGLRRFVKDIQARELSIAAKIDQARYWAGELSRQDRALRAYAALFLAATDVVAGAMPAMAGLAEDVFNTGNDAMASLRQRRLLSETATDLEACGEIRIGDDYLLAGRFRLMDLMDVCQSFLDVLEARKAGAMAAVPGADEVFGAMMSADRRPGVLRETLGQLCDAVAHITLRLKPAALSLAKFRPGRRSG